MPRVLNKHRDRIPPDAVWVMRPSKWGNPFVLGVDGGRARCLAQHAQWVVTRADLIASLPELAGYDLVCCCAPAACHADTLLLLANTTESQRTARAAALEGFYAHA